MSQYDTYGLFDFLLHTPEGGLRKMLVDRDALTDVHFNLLLKIVKSTNADIFSECFNNQSIPKVKMSPAELKLKETFWTVCQKTFLERGLLQPAVEIKIAA